MTTARISDVEGIQLAAEEEVPELIRIHTEIFKTLVHDEKSEDELSVEVVDYALKQLRYSKNLGLHPAEISRSLELQNLVVELCELTGRDPNRWLNKRVVGT